MIRDRLGRAAVRLYPQSVRDERGNELVGTLLDAGQESSVAFAGQLASLVMGGLAARSRQSLDQPLGRIAVDALCWVAVSIVMLTFVTLIAAMFRFGDLGGAVPAVAACGLILALFTVGRTRLAGIAGLVSVAALVILARRVSTSWSVGLLLPAAVGFIALTLSRRRTPISGRLLWTVPAIAYAAFQLWAAGQHPGSSHPLEALAAISPALAAIVFLPIAPAFAVGTALAWSLEGLRVLIIGLDRPLLLLLAMLSCAPVALALTRVARRAVSRF